VSAADDEIAASNAPLLDHLVELRQRLIRSLTTFFIAFILCFIVKDYILGWLLLPYQWATKLSGGDPDSIRLQSTQVLETFLTKMKIAAFGAVIVGFPVFAFQAYHFIAPGLYKNERMAFLPFLVAAPVLFLAGAAFVFFVMAPLIIWFGLSQQLMPDGQLQIPFVGKVSEYLSFMTTLILTFGLVFQLPVVTTLLVRVGLLTTSMLISVRKWAVVVAFIVSAMVTPSDLFSMFGLALPMILLYEFSILLGRIIEKKRVTAMPDSDDEEQSQM